MRRLRTLLQNFQPSRTWPEVGESTFILWEPCSSSHGEIVPGYTKYLLDLGYHVLVLMTPDRIDEGLFSRFPEGNFTLARLTQKQIRQFIKSRAATRARGLLVTTAGKLPKLSDASPDFDDVFGAFPPSRIHLVDHNAKDRLNAGSWDESIITLRGLVPMTPSKIVNPHYFGDVKPHAKSKDKIRFVMIGAARTKRRSDALVFDAVDQLLDAGLTNFEIRMIGKSGKTQIPDRLKPHFVSLGRLSFDQMYAEVEASDFILTAFQKTNSDHAFYRTTGTSGSFQLAYGFSKPIILQNLFAEGTAFADSNAIFYDEDQDFAGALKHAIQMSDADYTACVAQLAQAASDLYETSLTNMKDVIHG